VAITCGNTKLGKLIWGWTLPVSRLICIGMTKVCEAICYALCGCFLFANVRNSHMRNYEESLTDDFVANMNVDIRRNFAKIVRVHVGGDFYSVEYVRKWIEIVQANPKVVFYTYTRSWRDPEIYRFLLKLARESNFYMWWSCDRDTGKPPRSVFARTAYLMENECDLPPYEVDLVFRDKTSSVLKYTPKGSLVCPYDNGITKTTCSTCQICFRNDPVPRKELKNVHEEVKV
jgi:hypothetical protein